MAEVPVSVILPTYNRVGLLERAVRCVLEQEYRDLELIIVDDASSDGTPELVGRLEEEDRRLTFVRLQERRGAAAARNVGVAHSRGAVLGFQDSDDVWAPEKLGLQMEKLRESPPDVAVVYCPVMKLWGVNRQRVPEDLPTPEGFLLRLLEGNFISTSAALVRREAFEASGGFDESLPRLQDWELWIRLAQQHEFVGVDRTLAVVEVQPDSISRDPRAYREALALIVEKHEDLFRTRPRELATLYRDLAHFTLLAGEKGRGLRFLRRSLRLAPSLSRALALVLAALHPRLYGMATSRLVPSDPQSPFEDPVPGPDEAGAKRMEGQG